MKTELNPDPSEGVDLKAQRLLPTAEPSQRGERPVDMAAPLSAVDLPTYHELLPVLSERLLRGGHLAIVLIDLSEIGKIAQGQGSQTYDRMMDLLGSEIVKLRGAELRQQDLLTISEKAGDAFLVFLAPRSANAPPTPQALEEVAERVQGALNRRIASPTLLSLRTRPGVNAGFSLIVNNPLIHVTRLIQQGIKEARDIAYLARLYREARDKQRLQHIILTEDIRTVFQPVVDIKNSGKIHGFEALARGPRGTDLESPLALFDMAAKTNLLFELDQLCRRNSVQSAEGLRTPYKLFINTLPFSIRDPHFRGKFLLDLLDGSNLHPDRIVLEVTETFAIEDYAAYLEEMRYFSDMGFPTAIDDMGAGYSGLEKIVHLQPNYLKLDMHMVRGVNRSVIKRDIMQAFCTMAKKIGAGVVAEGVETMEELETVRRLGVEYAQGFLMARPTNRFQFDLNIDFGGR